MLYSSELFRACDCYQLVVSVHCCLESFDTVLCMAELLNLDDTYYLPLL